MKPGRDWSTRLFLATLMRIAGRRRVPYPLLTNDMHHEVELVVALKSGGMNIKPEKANDCIWGYGVGLDLTRRDLQIASRDVKRPWEIGEAFDGSRAVRGALVPAAKIGHPTKGRISLSVNGAVKQDGDLNQMIWNVRRRSGSCRKWWSWPPATSS